MGGLDDRVSSPAKAKERAELFKRLPGVEVKCIEKGGHCPHDEVPDAVASAVLKWFPPPKGTGEVVREGEGGEILTKEVVKCANFGGQRFEIWQLKPYPWGERE